MNQHTRKPSAPLGRNQIALLRFCVSHSGPHSLTANRQDPSHRALASLGARGLLVRSTVGATVFAELAEGTARARAVKLLVPRVKASEIVSHGDNGRGLSLFTCYSRGLGQFRTDSRGREAKRAALAHFTAEAAKL